MIGKRASGLAAILAAASISVASGQHGREGQSHKAQLVKMRQGTNPNSRGLVGTAAQAGNFRTLVNLVIVADLLEPLRDGGPFTLFAPTDEAFAKLPAGTVESLLRPENKEALKALLLLHVAQGKILAKDIDGKERPRTLSGGRLEVGVTRAGIFVNESTVVQADVLSRNGVIHAIDKVLTPSAPGLLAIAEKAGKFSTLIELLKVAKLDMALGGDGPFTVFAPTDEAFAKLGHETLSELRKPSNRGKLQEILKYHVAEGKVSARQVVSNGATATLLGQPVAADIKDGRVTINDARVLASDIASENGSIHVIDAVLLPKS